MWFEIKCQPNILRGQHNVLEAVQLVERYCQTKVKGLVTKVIQRGGWHAHSENLLLALLGSEVVEERMFAKEIRGDQKYGDMPVRDFHVPLLNFKADSLFNLINMFNGDLSEPVQTCETS